MDNARPVFYYTSLKQFQIFPDYTARKNLIRKIADNT